MIKIVIFIQIQYEHILIDCPPVPGIADYQRFNGSRLCFSFLTGNYWICL